MKLRQRVQGASSSAKTVHAEARTAQHAIPSSLRLSSPSSTLHLGHAASLLVVFGITVRLTRPCTFDFFGSPARFKPASVVVSCSLRRFSIAHTGRLDRCHSTLAIRNFLKPEHCCMCTSLLTELGNGWYVRTNTSCCSEASMPMLSHSSTHVCRCPRPQLMPVLATCCMLQSSLQYKLHLVLI